MFHAYSFLLEKLIYNAFNRLKPNRKNAPAKPERYPSSISNYLKHLLRHRFLLLLFNLRLCFPKLFHTPHRHAQTLGTFASGLWKLPLLSLCHLPILRQAGIRMDSLQECHHPLPSEKLVAALPGLYEWNCSFSHLPAAIL